MKRILLFILSLCCLIPLLQVSSFAASYKKIPILVNSKKISSFCGYLVNSVTYIPFKDFFECKEIAGASVKITNSGKSAETSVNGCKISAKSSQKYILCSGKKITGQTANRMINGKLYVPVRTAAACLDISVNWIAKTKTVDLIISDRNNEQNINNNPSNDKPAYSDEDLYWLSRIICAEAGNQPFDGMIAVGNVVMNRVRSVDYPDSIHDVIFDTKYGVQFTPTVNGTIYNAPNEQSIAAAVKVLEGYSLDNRILYFVNHDLSDSQWFYTRTFVFKIGDHSFYY